MWRHTSASLSVVIAISALLKVIFIEILYIHTMQSVAVLGQASVLVHAALHIVRSTDNAWSGLWVLQSLHLAETN